MNNVILVGRLSKDPDVRYTQSQMAVARFTVAVDRPPRGASQGDQPTADFIDVTAFGKTAEIIEKFFAKGKWIGVQGRIQNNNYTNKDGVKIYGYQVVADRIEFIGNKDGIVPPPRNNTNVPQDVPEGFAALDEDMPF